MKRYVGVMILLCLLAGSTVQAQLKVDFSSNASPVEAGYQGYLADHEVADSFTAQSYTAFGTAISIQASWAPDAVNSAMQTIDRGNGTTDGLVDLLRDWIGTDTRSAGDPLTLTISGLPDGTYSWLSYHHDRDASNMHMFDVTVNDATGSTTTTDVQITGNAITSVAEVATFTTTLVSTGDDITLVFDQQDYTNEYNEAWFVMNGFEIELISSGSLAKNPQPSNGEQDVYRDSKISWTPAYNAGAHNVYLSTNFSDVNDSSALITENLDVNSIDMGRLDMGQTYFWRVDEVNTVSGEITTGEIWSFNVEPVSYALTPEQMVVTASSWMPEWDPNRTIDGSGLEEDGHSNKESTMWLCAMADLSPWVQYDFNKTYQLDSITIWNLNQLTEAAIGWSAKDIVLETSLDGVEWTPVENATQLTRTTGQSGYNTPDVFDVDGMLASHVRIQLLNNWGGLIPQTGLSEVQIHMIPTYARYVTPEDGSTNVDPTSVASWRAGRESAQSLVSMSTEKDALTDGSEISTSVTNAEVALSTLGAELEQTYFWRVDEANEAEEMALWQGDVLQFSTQVYQIVDDFEGYSNTSPDRPFQTWLDGYGYSADEYFANKYDGNGTGSGIGHDIWTLSSPYYNGSIMEGTLTHEGSGQSMPFYYNGNSRTDRTFAASQDWTQAGVTALVLFFSGDRDNESGSLYVTINGKRVNYPDSSDLANGLWNQWTIDLSAINTDLSKVNSMSIGIDSAGSGVVYIDDIRLYRVAPATVESSDPGTSALVLHYDMENNVSDSSGNALNGTAQGSPYYAEGMSSMGMALEFDGEEDYVDLPIGSLLSNLGNTTISAWINLDAASTDSSWQRVFDFGTDMNSNMFMSSRFGYGEYGVRVAIKDPSANGGNEIGVNSGSALSTEVWHHVACVFDEDTLTLYVDGSSAGSVETTLHPEDLGSTPNNWLGQSQWADPLFMGLMDDFRIYNKDLTAGEIRYLAGDR